MDTTTRIIGAVAVLAALLPGVGAGAAEEGRRQHDAHAHGRATLQVAVDSDALVIELTVPAVHVVGFEHTPADDAERAAVREALAHFEHGEALLAPTPAAGCALASSAVELAGMEAGHGEDTPRSHEHGHVAERETTAGRGGETHAELHARYAYRCASPEKLEALGLDLFRHLEGVDAIEAQVVTQRLQTARELPAGTTLLRLVP